MRRLVTCNSILQFLFQEVIERLPWTDPSSGITIKDCTIVCGHRSKKEQDEAVRKGFSKAKFPSSKHNIIPSEAVDAMPYHKALPHIHWKDLDEMEIFSKLVLASAKDLVLPIRWGGDWDMDGVRVDRDPDERFMDGPHYEMLDVISDLS